VFRKAELKKYDHTTQVVCVPGGLKREDRQIKDDKKFINKTNQGHVFKVMRDYNSNINCLNNKEVESFYPTEQRFGKFYNRHENNFSNGNIIAPQNDSQKYNTFKISNKIDADRPFGVSSRPTPKPIVFRKGRPENIKNVFASQFQIC
jgi:hypothetical protein